MSNTYFWVKVKDNGHKDKTKHYICDNEEIASNLVSNLVREANEVLKYMYEQFEYAFGPRDYECPVISHEGSSARRSVGLLVDRLFLVYIQ